MAGGSTTWSVEELNVSSNYREAIKFTCSHGGSAVWDGSICLIGPLNFQRMINSRGEVTSGAGSGGGALDTAGSARCTRNIHW